MASSSEDAAAFIQGLAAMAGRLSAMDIVVSRLHCDWASFGSWSIEVQRGADADAYARALHSERWDSWGPDVVRITWDGHQQQVVVAAASTPPLAIPNQWEVQRNKVLSSGNSALRFAEDYLTDWHNNG